MDERAKNIAPQPRRLFLPFPAVAAWTPSNQPTLDRTQFSLSGIPSLTSTSSINPAGTKTLPGLAAVSILTGDPHEPQKERRSGLPDCVFVSVYVRSVEGSEVEVEVICKADEGKARLCIKAEPDDFLQEGQCCSVTVSVWRGRGAMGGKARTQRYLYVGAEARVYVMAPQRQAPVA